ncbi:MAG: hypothetical protein ACOWWR_04635 [Eubacteriales bacterium]
MESIKKFREIILSRKGKVVLVFVLLGIALLIVMPFIKNSIGIANLSIHHVEKIVYVKYEGEPFSSKVQVLKEYDHKNKDEIEKFEDMIEQGRVKFYPEKKSTSEMFFLYLEDGRVENAFIVDNMVGFAYGEYWISLQDIHQWIEKMDPRDNIKIEDLRAQ